MYRCTFLLCAVLCIAMSALGSDTPAASPVVIFWEENFPALDTAPPARADLAVREDKAGEYYHLVTLWKATKEEQQLYEKHS